MKLANTCAWIVAISSFVVVGCASSPEGSGIPGEPAANDPHLPTVSDLSRSSQVGQPETGMKCVDYRNGYGEACTSCYTYNPSTRITCRAVQCETWSDAWCS